VRLIMKLQRSALALGLLVMPLSGAAGCIHPKTYIAQGQVLTTGNAAYDDFFKSVRDIHSEAEQAKDDELASHAALIAALRLEPQTSAKMAVSEASQRAKKIRDAGILIHVELIPNQKIITKKEKWDAVLNPEGKDFLKAVEESTRSSLALSKRVGGIGIRAAQLEKVRTDLRAQAPVAFRAEVESRRDEIIEELDACAAVLTDAADLSDRYAGLAAKFALDLAHALDTGADGAADDAAAKSAAAQPKGAPAPAPPPTTTTTTGPPAPPPPATSTPIASAEPPPQPVAKRPPPRRPPRAPAAAKPPPAAAAAKKPKGNDDFDP
jgi:hypothetical protein